MAWSKERKFALLAGLYIAALVAANLVGNKVAVAACDTPFCYLGVWWLQGGKESGGVPEGLREV